MLKQERKFSGCSSTCKSFQDPAGLCCICLEQGFVLCATRCSDPMADPMAMVRPRGCACLATTIALGSSRSCTLLLSSTLVVRLCMYSIRQWPTESRQALRCCSLTFTYPTHLICMQTECLAPSSSSRSWLPVSSRGVRLAAASILEGLSAPASSSPWSPPSRMRSVDPAPAFHFAPTQSVHACSPCSQSRFRRSTRTLRHNTVSTRARANSSKRVHASPWCVGCHKHVCVRVYVRAREYVCVCVCMCMYVHVCANSSKRVDVSLFVLLYQAAIISNDKDFQNALFSSDKKTSAA